MNIILKDFLFLIKKAFLSEKKLLKKRIIRSIKNDYEKEISILPQLITANTDTIDVGVYRGVYSYELSKLSNHLHAFEANPILYKYLKVNLTGIIKNITLYNFALSDKNGTTLLRVPIRRKTLFQSQFEEKYHIGLGTIHENNIFNDFDEFNIKTIKLDEINFTNKISFIKIDVEGHELNVIEGAKETIRKHRPNLLVEIEEKHSHKKLSESLKYIENLRYKTYILSNNKLIEFNDLIKINNQINFIFIPYK